MDRAGPGGPVDGRAAGADPDAIRARRAAGLDGRPAGGPPRTRRALAQCRRDPGVRPDDPAAGPGPADPGADAGAPGAHPGRDPAGVPRVVRGYRGAVAGGAYRAGAERLDGPGEGG